MTTFVALLRAVNVGGRTLPMGDLRRALEAAEYADVRTYVQSGNVVFAAGGDDPRDEAAAIEELVRREFGLEVQILVLAADQLQQVAAANPFLGTGANERFLHVTFLFEPVREDVFTVLDLPMAGGERVALGGRGETGRRAVYLHLPHGYGRSKLTNGWFERTLKVPATTRNWRTVKALADLSSDHRTA